LELSAEEHRVLEARCRKRGILFLSTAFDEAGADFLDSLGVPAFKIASGDLTNHPFLSHVARKGKPVILSTGMATLAEVGEAVRVLRRTGNRKLVLLHCVSAYPTNPADVNLRAMDTLRRRFRVPTGYSDHTEALSVPLAAAALGAAVIEKHFTLDRSLPGPDQRMSIEPEELAAFVRGVREVEASLGDGVKRPAAVERETAAVARRSLAAARDLSSGERLDRSALAVLRPGTGLPPRLLPALLGRRLNRNVMAGTLLRRGWLR
jgi:sialic acid synthase SpsE